MPELQQDAANVATLAPPEPTSPTAPVSLSKEAADGLDNLANTLGAINAQKPQQQIQPSAPAQQAPPEIPAPPLPIPGAYSPEQEQASLRAAEAISNPAERLRLQGVLKREYANQQMADGLTRQAREDAKNKSFADYAKATHELLMDTKTDWATKLTIMKRLNEVMWQDPRLDYGDAKELLQGHMMKIATMPNTMMLGRGYQMAQDGILNQSITSNEQILRMEQQGQLTHEGATWSMQSLKELHEPKGVVNTARTEFFKRYSRSIDPGEAMGERSAPGDRAIFRAEHAARAREDALIKAGKDPSDIYNPDSKDFFGTPENIAKYAVSLADIASSIAGAGAPATAQPLSRGAPSVAPVQVPATITTREQLYDYISKNKLQPNQPLILPDGRFGKVPGPTAPVSR